MRLDQVLTLTRPLVGVDLETTGANVKTAGIVELALEIMVPGAEPDEYRTLVNPLMPIEPGATAVHGITDAMVQDAPTFRKLAANLAASLTDCDLAGYNAMTFDLPMLAIEFERAGFAWSYEHARVVDSFRLWQVAEGRTLSHAVERWLVPVADAADHGGDSELERILEESEAHSALWDIRVATRVAAAQLTACPQLPRDLDELHKLQWPDRYDADGKLRFDNLGDLCLNFGELKGVPLHRAALMVDKRGRTGGYLRWMLGADFSAKVKDALARSLRGERLTR